MTDYRYKWVSAVLLGEPDQAALARAKAKGWELVPIDEVPPDVLPPMIERPDVFQLHRMPDEVVRAEERERHAYNLHMARPETHIAIANANIRAYKEELTEETGRDDVGQGWSEIGGSGTSAEGTKIVYEPRIRHWNTGLNPPVAE